jgi:low affinity Fe/Cu permease
MERLAIGSRLRRSSARGGTQIASVRPFCCREDGVNMGEKFAHFANRASTFTGHYITFLFACALIIAWAISGPIFGFSETWQLVINTGTTIITFLMVFLIQNTQNRDAKAMHLKLDELIRSIDAADNEIIVAEDNTDEDLVKLKEMYERLSQEHAALQAQVGKSSRRGQGSDERADRPEAIQSSPAGAGA